MTSMSRLSKSIGEGSHKSAVIDTRCCGDLGPAQGVGLVARVRQGPLGPSLPGWVRERSAKGGAGALAFSEAEGPCSSEQYLTVAEAAAILRVSERTLRRHLAAGGIAHIRVGRQVRILRAGLFEGW